MVEKYPELIVPHRSALPQETYLSELALPFAVITELKFHENFIKDEEDDPRLS